MSNSLGLCENIYGVKKGKVFFFFKDILIQHTSWDVLSLSLRFDLDFIDKKMKQEKVDSFQQSNLFQKYNACPSNQVVVHNTFSHNWLYLVLYNFMIP